LIGGERESNNILPIAVGAGVGAPVAILIIIGGIFCLMRSRKKRADSEGPRDTELESSGDSSTIHSNNYTAPPVVDDSSSNYGAISAMHEAEDDDYAVGRFDTEAQR
jgi:hypothetical protein